MPTTSSVRTILLLVLAVLTSAVACSSEVKKDAVWKTGVVIEYRGEVETEADPESATIVLFLERKSEKFKYDADNPASRELINQQSWFRVEKREFRVRFIPDAGPAKAVEGTFTTNALGLLAVRLPPEAIDFGSGDQGCRLVVTSVEEGYKPKPVVFGDGNPVVGKDALVAMYIEHQGSGK